MYIIESRAIGAIQWEVVIDGIKHKEAAEEKQRHMQFASPQSEYHFREMTPTEIKKWQQAQAKK